MDFIIENFGFGAVYALKVGFVGYSWYSASHDPYVAEKEAFGTMLGGALPVANNLGEVFGSGVQSEFFGGVS